jgi:hypothetical protein
MTEIERTIMPPEEWFFNRCGSGDSMCLFIGQLLMQVFTPNISVPVLVLFTKFDALLVHAMGELEDENCDASLEALPAHAMKIFESYKLPSKLAKSTYPPKGHVTMEGKCCPTHCTLDRTELSLIQECKLKMEIAQS